MESYESADQNATMVYGVGTGDDEEDARCGLWIVSSEMRGYGLRV